MGFYKDLIDGLSDMIGPNKKFPNPTSMAKACNVAPIQINRLLSGERQSYIKALGKIIDGVGGKIKFNHTQEPTKDVHVVGAHLVNVPEGSPPPQSEDYLAVPLVAKAGAGPGRIDDRFIESTYLMVIRNHPAVHHRSNLIGMQVGKEETSMLGTIDPEDIVIVDRNDIYAEPRPPGNIYLVQDPGPDFGKAIKRVIFERKRKKMNIVYYSDNAVHNPPITYDFEEEFEGDIQRALIGRVVVSFSDMTKK